MTTLHVTVEFHEDETFASFVSRLAAANSALSAQTFCQHMGLRFQSLVDGEPESVSRLLSLARQQHKARAIGVGSRDERTFQFGNETMLRSNLSRSRLRACPHCLEQDEATGTGPTGTRAYGRLTWLPTFVRTCAEHGAFLASLPDPIHFGSPHDFAARVRLARDSWDEFRRNASPATPSEYEFYVRDRLLGRGQAPNWMDEFPLYVAGRLTEITGAILNHGRNFVAGDLTEREWLEAGRAGFAITSAGPTEFADFLRSLHDRFWEGNADFGGRVIYGRLYEMLAHENEDAAYDPIRELIKETAVASLPIGPDHQLFGIASPRRWHSVHTATKEFGLHHKTARKMFVAAGLIETDSETPDGRLLAEAGKVEAFIRRWQSSLKTDAAMKRVNIGRSSWEILLKEGYVTPLIPDYAAHGVAPLFPSDELERFDAKLGKVAPSASECQPDFVGLTTAAKRTSSRLADLLAALFAGEIDFAYTHSEIGGFDGVRVSVDDAFRGLNAVGKLR